MPLLRQNQNCFERISKNRDPRAPPSEAMQVMRQRIHSQEEVEMSLKKGGGRILESIVL